MTDFFEKIYDQLGQKYYMDYKGQELSERLSWAICSVTSLIGIIYGYYLQQLSMSVYICLGGIALATLLTVFPINFLYQKNPIKWQKVGKAD